MKEGDSAAFVLYAQGGFRVGGEISPEGCAVTVTALKNGDCLLCLPDFPGWKQYRKNGRGLAETPTETVFTGFETAIALSLEEGETALFSSVPLEELEYEEQEISAPNADWKRCGRAVLGSPRLMGGVEC